MVAGSNPIAAQTKIFGIGLSKTGTTSLASALEILGYRTKDYAGITRYVPGDLTSIDPAVLEQYEALTDTPIPSFYRELDRRYPGSKFILTVRDMEGWLLSCKKQFNARHAEKQSEANNQLFVDLYGTAVFDEARFRAGYERFVDGVGAYFERRPDDLLVLNIASGQGWKELCAFLRRPEPQVPFPKTNVTRIQWMDLGELVSIAQEAGEELMRAHREFAPEAPGAGAARLASIVRRTVYSLGGGVSFALRAAAAAAEKVLARRLGKLNADLAIVSRLSRAEAGGDAARWSHFWLVDPLDGEACFGSDSGEFTVNIALVEGRRPIAGIVYAPQSRTAYFGMVGKGAFKVSGDGPAVSLVPDAAGPPVDRSIRSDASAGSGALSLCRLLERAAGEHDAPMNGLMSWQTAAPHALARVLGRRLGVRDSGVELAYDPVDWQVPPLRVT